MQDHVKPTGERCRISFFLYLTSNLSTQTTRQGTKLVWSSSVSNPLGLCIFLASSPPSKRQAHPSNSPTARTVDLPSIDQHLGSNWTSSPGNPPSNYPSSSPLNGSFDASQSSTSSASPLLHSQTRIIDLRILSIHQSLHIPLWGTI
jgi:hypothetical protein